MSDDNTPSTPRLGRQEPDSWRAPPPRRSFFERAKASPPPMVAPMALATLATTAAISIPDPFKRAITVLGCAIVSFVVGWLSPGPKEY